MRISHDDKSKWLAITKTNQFYIIKLSELKNNNFDRVHRAKIIFPIAKLATLKATYFPLFHGIIIMHKIIDSFKVFHFATAFAENFGYCTIGNRPSYSAAKNGPYFVQQQVTL